MVGIETGKRSELGLLTPEEKAALRARNQFLSFEEDLIAAGVTKEQIEMAATNVQRRAKEKLAKNDSPLKEIEGLIKENFDSAYLDQGDGSKVYPSLVFCASTFNSSSSTRNTTIEKVCEVIATDFAGYIRQSIHVPGKLIATRNNSLRSANEPRWSIFYGTNTVDHRCADVEADLLAKTLKIAMVSFYMPSGLLAAKKQEMWDNRFQTLNILLQDYHESRFTGILPLSTPSNGK